MTYIKFTKGIRQPLRSRKGFETDIIEFNGQHPDFDQSPGPVLLATLESARTNEVLSQQYTNRVLPLIYSKDRPSYEEAFSTFDHVARALIEAM